MAFIKITKDRELQVQVRSPGPVFKYVHTGLVRLWKEAVGEFIKEAVETMAKDVDSGMSVASFGPLAAQIRLKQALIASIHGKGPRYRQGQIKHPDFNYSVGKGSSSKAAGQRLGGRAYALSFGSPQNMNFFFRFKIVVYQHYIHEISSNTDAEFSHSWGSLQAGRTAFLNHFNDSANQRRLIRGEEILQWLLTNKIPR